MVVSGQSLIAFLRLTSALGCMLVSGLRFESVVLYFLTATRVLDTASLTTK